MRIERLPNGSVIISGLTDDEAALELQDDPGAAASVIPVRVMRGGMTDVRVELTADAGDPAPGASDQPCARPVKVDRLPELGEDW